MLEIHRVPDFTIDAYNEIDRDRKNGREKDREPKSVMGIWFNLISSSVHKTFFCSFNAL